MCSQMPIKKIKVVSLLQQIYMASTSGECKESSCLFTFLVNQLGKLGIKFKVYCTHWLYCLALYTEQVATSEQTILDCKKLLVLYLFQIIHGEAKCEQRLTKCESFVTCKQYDNMIYVCLIIIIIIKHIYKYKKFHKT